MNREGRHIMELPEMIESAGHSIAEGLHMDYQVLFNIVLGLAGTLFGILITNVWSEIKQLQANERETTKRISEIERLVAGNYTTREEFSRVMDKVFSKLDAIDGKLNSKADR